MVKKYDGFSIVEALLTLTLMTFLVAAVIPMLGGEFAKSQKKPQERDFHGLIECFWKENASGDKELFLYTQDTVNSPEGNLEPLGTNVDFCEVSVPKTNYYKVHAIGAGSNGAHYTDSGNYDAEYNKLFTETINGTTKTGSVTVNNTFSDNAKSIPQPVYDAWMNTNKVTWTFSKVRTAHGAYYNGNPCCTNQVGMTALNCDSFGTCKGSAGNKITEYDFGPVIIKPNSNVSIDRDNSGSGTGSPVTVDKFRLEQVGSNYSGYSCSSGKVEGGTKTKDCTNGSTTNSNKVTTFNAYNANGVLDNTLLKNATPQQATLSNGTTRSTYYTGSYPVIPYEYRQGTLKVKASHAGNQGKDQYVVYEKLDVDKFRLYPAKDTSTDSIVYALKQSNGTTKTTNILTAESANPADTNMTIENRTYSPDTHTLEELKKAIEDFVTGVSKVDGNNHTQFIDAYRDMEKNQNGMTNEHYNLIPGAPGYGGHDIINTPGPVVNIKVNGQTLSGVHKLSNDGSNLMDSCINGRDAVVGVQGGHFFCPAGAGHSGAVVISW